MPKKDGRSISRETLEYLRSQSIKVVEKSKEIEDIVDFSVSTLDLLFTNVD